MEEELGNGWTEAVHTEDYARCLKTYVTSFEAREPFKMEYRLRCYDGAIGAWSGNLAARNPMKRLLR
jgi:PAS domain-containing protein